MESNKREKIPTQAWRIPRRKISINVLKDGVEENVGAVFNPSWDGEVNPCADEPCDTRRCFSQDKGQNRDGIDTARNCLKRQEEIRLYFYRKS